MSILVQKFGGTSMATPEYRAACVQRVLAAQAAGDQVAVVVSAMGRMGEPYATDSLLQLIAPEGTPGRDVDLLLGCGEVIAAVVFASELRQRGASAMAFTGAQAGIMTDGIHRDAKILSVDCSRLHQALDDGQVPVVAGFQGVSAGGELTTLGRGGSDTSATALGVALGAREVEIYTDVEGIKTADPRIVPEARTLRRMDYDESLRLAQEGAKVIHPRAVDIARQAGLPVRVKGTLAEHPGTLISGAERAFDRWPRRRSDQVVTGVTSRVGIAQIIWQGASRPDDDLKVFDRMAEAQISVDLINVFPDRKSFTVELAQASAAKTEIEHLGFAAQVREDIAKVSIVGTAIHGLPGVMAHVVRAMHQASAPILATADSHLTISCLVPLERMPEAVRALHREFNLHASESEEHGDGWVGQSVDRHGESLH